MRERRRRRRPAVAGLKRFWLIAAAAAVVAVAAGYFVVSWQGFRVKHVRVVGNAVVPTAEILAQAHVDTRENEWLMNSGAMARRIQEIPYVLSARVHRLPPGTITIDVTERRPFAIVRSGDATALVDERLRVLQDEPAGEAYPALVLDRDLVLVPGRFLMQHDAVVLRNALVSMRAHGLDVLSLQDDGGEVTAVLSGNVRVLLGDEANLGTAIPLVAPILTRFTLLGRPVAALDVRSPSTPVVTERRAPETPKASRSAKPAPAARRSP